jgi:hypothetical protein
MIGRLTAKAETALREALAAVARHEEDQIEPALAVLDDRERGEALGLAILIAGYVVVDVSGTKWLNKASVRQIAEDLATTGTGAKRFRLDAAKIYEYLSRAVLGSDRLEDVIPGEPEFTRFPVIVAQRALSVYCPKGIEVWDYVDQIESAIEIAWTLNSTVLPAAVLRSYIPPLKSGDRADNP